MRGDTIRRLLVFGVCALGVSALYLVPGVRTPVASQPRNDRPTSAPLAATTTKPVTYATTGPATTAPATSEATTATITTDPESVAVLDDQAATTSPSADDDSLDPPPPVPTINIDRVTPDEATISWPKAPDSARVAGYRISLNGFVIETTTKTSATVHWFNDDSEQQFVEVRTVDPAGRLSDRPARLLTRRPDPSPTPSDTPTPDPSTATPSPDATTPSASSQSSEPPAAKSGAAGEAGEAAAQSSEPGPTPSS